MTDREQEQEKTIETMIKLVRELNTSLAYTLAIVTFNRDEGQFTDEIKQAIAINEIADTI